MLDHGMICVDFSGFVSVDPRRVRFEYIGADKKFQPIINGSKYLTLSDDDKAEYVFQSMVDVLLAAEDLEWSTIEIEDVTL
jgi:hypothetical protein